jgi:hypothetical protein
MFAMGKLLRKQMEVTTDHVEIQAQDTTGVWRTYHITNINNSQVVLIEIKSLKSRHPDFRVRAVDRTGRLIDLLE